MVHISVVFSDFDIIPGKASILELFLKTSKCRIYVDQVEPPGGAIGVFVCLLAALHIVST